MAKVLIIRLSAIGDVAMTIPVCYSVARQNPHDQFVFLSKPMVEKMLVNPPDNLCFLPFDTKNEYAGITGVWRMFCRLRKMKFDKVADLHNVMRSIVLRILFKLCGAETAFIHKGRKEKFALINRTDKTFVQLKHSVDRYKEVFERLGYRFPLTFRSLFDGTDSASLLPEYALEKKQGKRWIGIAPFAQHEGKIYPPVLMEQVVERLSATGKYRIFLFGGGEKEKNMLGQWERAYDGVESMVGRYSMSEELVLMSRLDLMLAMDSANMHMASLTGLPVVSIWGATHPFAGFYGYNQSPDNILQVDLSCRPCSVFGNKPCFRGDYACLNLISPNMVIRKIEQVLGSKA